MNTKRKQFFVILFVITALIFRQHLALNLLLIAIISVIYLKMNRESNTDFYWWLSAFLWIGSGMALTLNNGYMSPLLYGITGLHFFNVAQTNKSYFPYSLLKTTLSFFIGIILSIFPKSFLDPKPIKPEEDDNSENIQKSKTNETLKKVLTYSIPLVIVIVFLKLYQSANPKFEEYTAFLNLDFIDWNFITLYFVLYIFTYGLFFYNPVGELDELGNNKSKNVANDYSDAIEKKIGIETELKMTKLIVITLLLLLTAFLIVDTLTVFNVISSDLSHSANVHQGIFVLITSVVFVIIIVSFAFRGQLNFIKDKYIKPLTITWLILNIFLIGLNVIKNYNYISDWGLTHKRIGVFVYLTLCVIGLTYTIYKIKLHKSFWFLMNRTLITFLSILVAYTLINWNGVIAKYNLAENRFNEDKIDLYYNINLGYEAYPYLIDYFEKNPKTDSYVYERLNEEIKFFSSRVNNWRDFPSFNLSRYMVYQKLKDYKPLNENDYDGYR